MSAKKRTSLDAVFRAEELSTELPQTKGKGQDKPKEPTASTTENLPQERAGESKRPNVKQHTAYLPLAVHEQLRKLAFEENRKMHDYLIEGLDRVSQIAGFLLLNPDTRVRVRQNVPQSEREPLQLPLLTTDNIQFTGVS